MPEFFTNPLNYPFFSAAFILVLLLGLELIALLFGASLTGFFDSHPDIHLDTDLDADAPDLDGAGNSFIANSLGWIRNKQVPLLITLVLLLMFFSLSGYLFQLLSLTIWNRLMPYYLSIPFSILVTLPLNKVLSGFMAVRFFKDESSAVSENSFIGKIAEINSGTAKKGFPAEAKLKDEFGQFHYIMVEPENDSDIFETGTQVILIERKDYYFTSILLDI